MFCLLVSEWPKIMHKLENINVSSKKVGGELLKLTKFDRSVDGRLYTLRETHLALVRSQTLIKQIGTAVLFRRFSKCRIPQAWVTSYTRSYKIVRK